jgi:hypothetical protein
MSKVSARAVVAAANFKGAIRREGKADRGKKNPKNMMMKIIWKSAPAIHSLSASKIIAPN